MSYITNPAPPNSSRKWLRLIFPPLIIVVFGGIFALSLIGTSLHWDTDENFGLFIAMYWLAPPIGLLLLFFWWMLFSGLRWRIRLLLPLAIALIIGAWFAASMLGFSPLRIELTTQNGRMEPVLHPFWEKTTLEEFKAFQNEQPKSDLPPIDATVGATDFARYRGPKADGVVTHLQIDTHWTKNPPTELWRHPCVEGYSGVAVAGNIAVTLEQRSEQEVVACYDRQTGRQRWAYTWDAHHKDVMGAGPRGTPTIHDGLVFALGAQGQLTCVTAEGKHQWGNNVLRDARAKAPQWGLSGSPLIVNDLVVVNAGVDPQNRFDAAVIAYDYKTGVKRWARGNRKAGYSSPHLARLSGVTQILVFDGEALAGFDPKDGRELWSFPWVTDQDMADSQPVIVGDDRVFISSEARNGSAVLRVAAPASEGEAWKVEPVWHKKTLGARFSNPVYDGKRIFGLHNVRGFLKCLNVEDGSVQWEGSEYGPGQMLLVDDVLLVINDKGTIFLIDPTAGEEKILARHTVFDRRTWNTPAIAGDQLFMRNQSEIACLKLPRR